MNAKNYKKSELAIIAAAMILCLFFILAGTIPLESFWGFNHLKYFPPFVTLIYALLFLCILIPATSNGINKLLTTFSDRFKSLPGPVKVILVFTISAVIFYFFRVHVYSLGDGYQRIYQIEQGYLFFHTETLDFFLHGILYRFLNLLGKFSAEWVYIFFSILTGIGFVLTVFFVRPDFDSRPETRIFIKVALFALGGLQLFFGYVESYSLFYAFSLLYLFFASDTLFSGRRLLTASIILALALVSHEAAMVFVPSYLYLAFKCNKTKPKIAFSRRIVAFLIVIVPTMAVIGMEIWLRLNVAEYLPELSGGILPIYSPGSYAIISPRHLLDVLNEFLLISPIPFLILPILFISYKSNSNHRAVTVFSIVIIISSLAMLLLLDPKLGYARDWDLFSIPAAAVGLGSALLLISRISLNNIKRHSQLILAALPIIFLSGWITLNASEKRQLDRAESLLKLSDRGAGYATELLAHYYSSRLGDNNKALRLLESIEGSAKNARVYGKIARALYDQGRPAEAMANIYRGLAIDSNAIKLYQMAGDLMILQGRPDSSLPYLIKAARMDPVNYGTYYSLGVAYRDLDSLSQSVSAFQQAIKIRPESAGACFKIGQVFYLMGRSDSAFVYVERGLHLNPNYPGGADILETIKRGR
nr:hypothetical protein [candidate division Zixibacteria bacterium]